jgi:DNA-binding MarR family transcriptional regulator
VSSDDDPGPELTTRLGYLLKHAQQRMAGLSTTALAPFGIQGRELAVLLVVSGREPASQQQVAQRMGVDRTTMVALLDTLEGKGLVSRHPHADDRRRNVVELTSTGRDIMSRASQASDDAERAFLAPLGPQAAQQFRESLRAVATDPDNALRRPAPPAGGRAQ